MIQLVSKTAMLDKLLLLLSLHLLRCSFPATSQEEKTTWKGGANQRNVRKKARKVERSRVLFPQCQIWIVSANKRDDTTQQIKPLNISLPTSENPWPPTIASKKMRAAINHALSWPENFHRRGCLRFFCCLGMAETYLCKYRGIAWSPNS